MELEIILKIVLAAVLGGIIGLERELSHKEAGLKANVMVAVGSALMTVLALKLAGGNGAPPGAPSAMTGHIITALGLLGTGIIIKERFTQRGIETAAVLFCTGALGMAVGGGYYLPAFAVTILIVSVLFLLKRISAALEKQGKVYVYIISTEENAAIFIEVKKAIMELGIQTIDSRLRKTLDGYEIELALVSSLTKNKTFMERVMQIPDVKEIISENL